MNTRQAAFAVSHPSAWDCIQSNPGFGFAVDMAACIARYGSLTPNQLSAVLRCADRAKTKPQAQAMDPALIEAAFAKASQTLQKPILRVAGLTISRAAANSKNPGALYVKEKSTYLGKIMSGAFTPSRDCTPLHSAKLEAIATDPRAAALAHGIATGICSCCNRTLTDPESVARGIGPICAEKFGW